MLGVDRFLKSSVLLVLFVLVPLSAHSVEWRLTITPAVSLGLSEQPGNYSSSSWEGSDQGFVYITMMESNETIYQKQAQMAFDLGLEAWLTSQWGLILQGGFSPLTQKSSSQNNLDFIWYDDETGYRYRSFDTRSSLNRFWLDFLLSHRLFIGQRLGIILSAGLGLHHLDGQVQREYGWAATLKEGQQAYFDYFQLPLVADISKSIAVGQLSASLEYRLTRTVVGRVGIAYWLASTFEVPYRMEEGQTYYGAEGHMVLSQPAGLLSNEELQTYTFDPSALRFTFGISFWL